MNEPHEIKPITEPGQVALATLKALVNLIENNPVIESFIAQKGPATWPMAKFAASQAIENIISDAEAVRQQAARIRDLVSENVKLRRANEVLRESCIQAWDTCRISAEDLQIAIQDNDAAETCEGGLPSTFRTLRNRSDKLALVIKETETA